MSALNNKLRAVGKTKISFRFLLAVVILLFALPHMNFYLFKFAISLTGNKEKPSFLLNKTYSIPSGNFSYKYPYNFKIREYNKSNFDSHDNSTQYIFDFLETNLLRGTYIRTEIFEGSKMTPDLYDQYSKFLPEGIRDKADYYYDSCSAMWGIYSCNAQSMIKLPGEKNKLLYINCNNYGKDNLCHILLPQMLSTLKFE